MPSNSNDKLIKVVVVDDDDIAVEFYSRLLRNLPCSITTFVNPLDSLSLLTMEEPDLLLVDMEMPCIDGLALLTTLTSQVKYNHCRMFLCSVITPSSDVHSGAEKLGVTVVNKDHVLTKTWLENVIRQCQSLSA